MLFKKKKNLKKLCTVNFLFVDFSSKKGGGFGGMFGMLKGLVGSKSLTREDMESVLEKMKDHLISMIQHLSLTHPLDFRQHLKVHCLLFIPLLYDPCSKECSSRHRLPAL